MNILAYDNSRYLVNLDNMTDNVYIVDIKLRVICGYDNVHKIMRFGNYSYLNIEIVREDLLNELEKIFTKNNIKISL